jgi:uracil phosphoribosyltransferase
MKGNTVSNAKTLLISVLRDKSATRTQFRHSALRLAEILAYEAASTIEAETISIETPISRASGLKITKPVVLVPILRSGLALLPAFLKIFTEASVGVVGMKRDEHTAEPMLYYKNIPPINANAQVIVLDPMIATGGSGVDALKILTEMGVRQDQIIFVGVISAPEGLSKMKHAFPDVRIIVGIQDQGLTPNKFITPGLGDFGDRFFGTE